MDTECQKCIFCDSESWCDFSIPSVLDKKTHNIDESNKIIKDYRCWYAFGKQAFATLEQETKESLSEKIIQRNQLATSIVINFETCNTSSEEICDIISNLDFRPKNILCYGKNITQKDIDIFKEKSCIPWKLNHIQPDIPETIALVSSIDTNTGKNNSVGFLHLSSKESLLDLDNIINALHIAVVINQQNGIFYKTKHSLDGMFMFYDDYKTIGTDKLILIDSPWLFFDLDSYKNTPVNIYTYD